jgi:hypothetical protein
MMVFIADTLAQSRPIEPLSQYESVLKIFKSESFGCEWRVLSAHHKVE